MIIKSKVADRKQLVKELCTRLQEEAKYQGAPGFCYQVGIYTVLKNGDLEVDEEKANPDFIRELIAQGLIEEETPEESEETITISIPMDGHTPRSITNLINIFCSREKLINKSVGCSHAFCMNKAFADSLDRNLPETIDELLTRMDEAGGRDINRGLSFKEDSITFTGFPFTQDSGLIKAYMEFAELINKSALEHKRVVKGKCPASNEKYSFRVWLLSLGMVGEQYKETRKLLLKNLPGNTAFRTPEQAEAFKDKMKAKRKEERSCSEYQAL